MQERVGVVGSGVIARGLAAVAAEHGEVLLWARSEESARRATTQLSGVFERLDEQERLDRVTIVTDIEALAEATFLVEAIVEEHDAKAELLAELDRRVGENALLATTTSSLRIDALADASGRPDRFLGFHVFNPVPKMALVELTFPTQATDATRTRAHDLCATLGKTTVEVPDVPGFVVNRLLFPYLFSAVRLLEETGMAPQDVDTCMTLGERHPMGPLALLDLVGLDVAQAIGDAIGEPAPARLTELVANGALGRKSGRGFHDYSDEAPGANQKI